MFNFNRKVFFDEYRKVYGELNSSQVRGLEYLLSGFEHDAAVTDIRWVAYMMATVKHETANTFKPIEEYGKGKGHTYGNLVKVDCSSVTELGKKEVKRAYYGRGYVQLTHSVNYKNIGQGIALGDRLLCYPELALDPEIAYKVMSYGMRNGTFTGKRLSTYFGKKTDYKNARKIINGLDKADLIAGYALNFESILNKATKIVQEPIIVPQAEITVEAEVKPVEEFKPVLTVTSSEATPVTKEKASLKTRIITGGTAAVAFLSSVGFSIGTFLQQKLESITVNQIVVLALFLLVGVAAVYFWDKASERAAKATALKMASSADKDQNSIELVNKV